jgi:phenylpropionate dioxygenase-like ring-hydroxylating dioxygenase large terminal subunit
MSIPVAPLAERFPTYPASWYLFGRASELRRGPVSRELLGRRLVAFRTATGRLSVLDGRCAHLGTDLGAGLVRGETLQCPFHQWCYGTDGRCVHIPATSVIPDFARLEVYPAVERHGFVYFFNARQALFPLPFFPGVDPDDFVASEPFDAVLHCPWWMVMANVFDIQHFRSAHDRKLLEAPVVERPAPYARRITAAFAVLGDTLRDSLVRRLAGDRVVMSFTVWCGNILFATPTFRRTTSYGMLISEPLGRDRVHVHGLVFVRRHRRLLGRWLVDPLRVRIRRYFIKEFLQSDVRLGAKGLSYNPAGLLEQDEELIRYFDWLAGCYEPRPSQ